MRRGDIVPQLPDDPYFTETIQQWLSRPYPVASFPWTSDQNAGDRIGWVSFPEALFSIPALYNKLQNFQYFRAGVKIGLRMNGTKFHYGKLLLAWVPQDLNIGAAHFRRIDNVFSASACPHVIISPTENEVHEFVMPFAVPFSYIDMSQYTDEFNRALFNIGCLRLYVLNPLSLGADPVPNVGISIFASFVTPEVAGYSATTLPTFVTSTAPSQDFPVDPFVAGLPAVPSVPNQLEAQMLTSLSMPFYSALYNLSNPSREMAGIASNFQSGPSPSSSVSARAPEAQMSPGSSSSGRGRGATGARMVGDPEGQEKSSRGVISGVAERVAKIAALMVPVPGIGQYMGGLAGASGIISRIAKSLGYCKPLSSEAIHRQALTYPFLASTHGLDNAVSLSIDPNNKVAPAVELMGGFEDEETLAYLISTPTLLTSTNITTSFGTGTQIMRFPVSVGTCGVMNLITPLVFPTMLSYVADSFKYWRGSIKFCIQITASSFHSCRLRISWDPAGGSNVAVSDVTKSNRISHVLDIQTETEFYFTIPYLASLPWLICPYSGLSGRSGNAYGGGSNGVLEVSMVNELTHPETPTPAIMMNIWICGGEDMQFAYPRTPPGNEYTPPTLEAQWSTREMMRNADYKPLIPAFGAIDQAICHGEIVTSVRELIKRPGVLEYADLDDITNFAVTLIPHGTLTIYPDSHESNSATAILNNHLNHFRAIYKYSRGSVVYRMLYKTESDDPTAALASSTDVGQGVIAVDYSATPILSAESVTLPASGTASTNSLLTGLGYGTHRTANLALQPLEVSVPFYSDQFAYPNSYSSTNYPRIFNSTVTAKAVMPGNAYIVRAAGDDYQLIFQVGPPATNAAATLV